MNIIIPSAQELVELQKQKQADYMLVLEKAAEKFINNNVRQALLSVSGRVAEVLLPDIGQASAQDFHAFCITPLQNLGYSSQLVKAYKVHMKLTW